MKILRVHLQFCRPWFGSNPDNHHPIDFHTRLIETDEGFFLVRYEHPKKDAVRVGRRARSAERVPVIYKINEQRATQLNALAGRQNPNSFEKEGEDGRVALEKFIDQLKPTARTPEEMGDHGAALVAAYLIPANAPGAVPPFAKEAENSFWWVRACWREPDAPWSPAKLIFSEGRGRFEGMPRLWIKNLAPTGDQWIAYSETDVLKDQWGGPVAPPVIATVPLPSGSQVSDFAMMLRRVVRAVRRGKPESVQKICDQADDLLRRKGNFSILRSTTHDS